MVRKENKGWWIKAILRAVSADLIETMQKEKYTATETWLNALVGCQNNVWNLQDKSFIKLKESVLDFLPVPSVFLAVSPRVRWVFAACLSPPEAFSPVLPFFSAPPPVPASARPFLAPGESLQFVNSFKIKAHTNRKVLIVTLCSRRVLFSAWASLSRRSISSSLAIFEVLALHQTNKCNTHQTKKKRRGGAEVVFLSNEEGERYE